MTEVDELEGDAAHVTEVDELEGDAAHVTETQSKSCLESNSSNQTLRPKLEGVVLAAITPLRS